MQHAKAMVLASFTGDALALGPHWIYDTAVIDEKYGEISTFTTPQENSYHSGRTAGEFTHYGDQTLLLLKNISEEKGFSPVSFFSAWLNFAKKYDGYMDGATKKSLINAEKNPGKIFIGSPSADLGGAARIAPLIYLLKDNRAALMKAVQEQTKITHTSEDLLVGADFITQLTLAALDGSSPRETIEQLVSDGINSIDLAMRLERCLDTAGDDSRKVIQETGAMCGVANALPGAVHFILKHQDNLRAGLIDNVMAGGDSAARGLVIGMVLGAWLGEEAIPTEWLESMKKTEEIQRFLSSIDQA